MYGTSAPERPRWSRAVGRPSLNSPHTAGSWRSTSRKYGSPSGQSAGRPQAALRQVMPVRNSPGLHGRGAAGALVGRTGGESAQIPAGGGTREKRLAKVNCVSGEPDAPTSSDPSNNPARPQGCDGCWCGTVWFTWGGKIAELTSGEAAPPAKATQTAVDTRASKHHDAGLKVQVCGGTWMTAELTGYCRRRCRKT